ncbi:MAG: TonB family protein [Desulfobacteria bacterium]
MLDIRNNSGLLISGILHVLIMAIPVSMAVVQKFNEVELFVMEEERPVIQQIKAVKHKMPEVVKVTKEEIKREEIPQKIEEEPVIIPLPPSVNSNPPTAEVREVASVPQISLPQQQTSQPHDVEFGTAIGPKFLHRELPAYPMIARRLRKEGEVVLRLTLDERGNLLNVEVVKNAGYGFTEAAVEAVKRSTFLPAKKDGRTIVSRAILPIRFTLLENASPFRAGMKK